MKTIVLVPIGLAGVLLGGCLVQSLQPLFTEKELIPYPALVGAWTQKDEHDKEVGTWTFAAKDKQYTLTHTDEKKRQAAFHVAAGKIGTNVFLDMSPDGDELNDLLAVHLIPAHTFAKPVKTKNALVLIAMDLDWLAGYLKENPNAIAHFWRGTEPDKIPVLTASTEDLQRFVAKYAHDDKVFKNEIKLVPKNPAP